MTKLKQSMSSLDLVTPDSSSLWYEHQACQVDGNAMLRCVQLCILQLGSSLQESVTNLEDLELPAL